MSDPTALVLTVGFAVTLGLFVLAAAGQVVRRGTRHEVAVAAADTPEVVATAPPPELPRGRVPVWFYRPLDLLGAGFVFCVFGGLVLAAVHHPSRATASLEVADLVANIGFQVFIAGCVAILALRRASWCEWLGLRWASWPKVFLIAPAAVLFIWLIFAGLHVCGYVEWLETLGVDTVQDSIKLLHSSRNPQVLALMGLAAVVVAPVCEEIVFRGYFYPVLKKYAGMWPAALCTALLFGCAHGELGALLPLVLFGGLLVFLYEKTGSLWAPIAVHFCFNGATVAMEMIARYYDIPLQAPQ